ncbi:MAG: AAA family ATPase [Methylocystis sp.]
MADELPPEWRDLGGDATYDEPGDFPPPIGEPQRDAGRESRSARFQLVRFDEIKPASGTSYLVKGLIPSCGLTVIWGPPKCGKSFLTFDIAMHVALDWDYRGRRVKAGPVVYCALEGAEGFRARVEAFRREKLSDANPPAPFHLMSSPINLVADHAAFVAAIRAQLSDSTPVAVVIDTLNRSLAGSESDDKDISAYVRAADAIRDAFDCAIIIVHHCGHGGDRPRGHSSLMGALDAQIAVKRDAADNIVATLELSKDGPVGLEIVSRLVPVDIGVDEDGDAITSCVIEAVEAPTVAKVAGPSARLPKGAQIALRALREALDECGVVPPASNHIPRNTEAVTVNQWRTYAYRMGVSTSDEDRARRQAFHRATEALLAAKQACIWDTFVWQT